MAESTDSFDVSGASEELDRPKITVIDWDDDTITLEVLGNNETGTFKRARAWLNFNTSVPVEPTNRREPVSVEEVGLTDFFVRKYRFEFRRL
jgi:hypothetical protein